MKIRLGSTEIGQGTRTMHAQIVADALGVPFEAIEVHDVDTRFVPDSGAGGLVLFEGRAVYCIRGTEPMFKRGSGTNISQLGLYHRPQIAWRMVSEFDDLARLAFENDNHAASNLGCRNSHKTEVSV